MEDREIIAKWFMVSLEVGGGGGDGNIPKLIEVMLTELCKYI